MAKNANADESVVFLCEEEEEIKTIMKCSCGNSLSVRGGGHAYNNLSVLGKWIINPKNIRLKSGAKFEVNSNKGLLKFVPSLKTGELYKALHDVDPLINIIAPASPTVGITGFMMGGGHGVIFIKKYLFKKKS